MPVPVIMMGVGLLAVGFKFVGLGLSLLAYGALGLFQKKPRMPTMRQKGLQVTTKNAFTIIPVVYGTMRVGGNMIYANSESEGKKWMHMAIALGEGECNGINYHINEPQIYFDDIIYNAFDAGLIYKFYEGTTYQDPDPDLVAIFNNDPAFNDAFRNSAYLYIALQFDPVIYKQIPNITVVLEGKKLFDPRDDSWKFTSNPSLVIRDFLTSKRYGKGEDISKIDSTTFNSVANTMEEYTWSDLACTTDSTTLTSATGGFSNLSVGDYIEIYSGTNFEAGRYKILAIADDNTVTLNRTASPSGANTESQGTEVVTNGTFENWTGNSLDSWTLTNCDVYQSRPYVKITPRARSATRYYKAEGHISQDISSGLTSGNTYRIQAKVRSGHTAGYVRLRIISDNSAGNYVSDWISSSVLDTSISTTWTATFTSTVTLRIEAYGLTSTSVFARDVSIKEVTSTNGSSGIGAKMLWTIDGAFYKDEPARDILEDMLLACRCALVKSGGIYKLYYLDTSLESVDMDLTEDDVIEGTLSVSAPGSFGKGNKYKFQFYNAEINYKLDEVVITTADYDPEVDEENEVSTELLGITNRKRAVEMATYLVNRSTIDKTISFVATEKASRLDPYDIITLTHSVPGWYQKEMRVVKMEYNPNYTVSLVCQEERDNIYSPTVKVSAHSDYDTNLPDPKENCPEVIDVSLSEEEYSYRGRSFTRIYCTFGRPVDEYGAEYPWYKYTQVWISFDADNYEHIFNVTDSFHYENVEEGKTYYFKLRNITISDNYGTTSLGDLQTYSITIQGVLDQNSGKVTDITSGDVIAINSDDVLTVKAEEVTGDYSDNIDTYEFRLSPDTESDWYGSLFIGTSSNGTLDISGIRPSNSEFINGSTVKHRVWCSPKSLTGRYSTNPRYVDIAVPLPSGKVEYQYFYVAQGTGTHSNTEFVDIGGGDYVLRVDHTGGLSGTYVNAEIDLGAGAEDEVFEIWGDFVTNFTKTNPTFDNIFGTTSWEDNKAGFMDNSWDDIFLTSNAALPTIQATLAWDNTSHSGDTDITNYTYSNKNFFMRRVRTSNCRYLRVKIEITDPADNAYLRLDGDTVYSDNNVLRISIGREQITRTAIWGIDEPGIVYSPI